MEINKPEQERFNPKTATYISIEEEKKRKQLYIKCVAEKESSGRFGRIPGTSLVSFPKTIYYRVSADNALVDYFDAYIEIMAGSEIAENRANFIQRMTAYRVLLTQRNLMS